MEQPTNWEPNANGGSDRSIKTTHASERKLKQSRKPSGVASSNTFKRGEMLLRGKFESCGPVRQNFKSHSANSRSIEKNPQHLMAAPYQKVAVTMSNQQVLGTPCFSKRKLPYDIKEKTPTAQKELPQQVEEYAF